MESGKLLPGVSVIIADPETKGQCGDSILGEVGCGFSQPQVYHSSPGSEWMSAQCKWLLHDIRQGWDLQGSLRCQVAVILLARVPSANIFFHKVGNWQ